MNLDGIPELHTKGNTYNIFSFCNKNVIGVYKSDAGFDTYLLLKKPALMAIKTSTGTMYQYTTIDSALVATTIEFFGGKNAWIYKFFLWKRKMNMFWEMKKRYRKS